MISLERVPYSQEQTLHNMMQFYIYEFSQFITSIKLEDNGTYKPFDLKDYWNNENFHPFFIKKEGEIVGFVLVELGEDDSPHSINEFFIMKKFNGKGYGSIAAREIFTKFKGKWQITQIANNYPAQAFWRKVINEFTEGHYVEYYDQNRRSIQEFTSK